MGSSKIIMLSGVYLIFGFYTIAFNNADESMFKTSTKSAALAQEELLAQTGLSLAGGYMGTNSARSTYATRTFVSGIDTVKYSATQPAGFPASQTQVTSTASHTTVVGGGNKSDTDGDGDGSVSIPQQPMETDEGLHHTIIQRFILITIKV